MASAVGAEKPQSLRFLLFQQTARKTLKGGARDQHVRCYLGARSILRVVDLKKVEKLWPGDYPHDNFMPSALSAIKCLSVKVLITLGTIQYQGGRNTYLNAR